MVVYFTGTGNSRYCAEMIAGLIGDETVDAVKYIKSGTQAELKSEKPWVFVCPIYVSAPPLIFKDFIASAKLEGSKEAYFVMTCASGMGAAPYYCKKLCEDKELEYMGTAQVEMPQNYLILFKMNDPESSHEIVAAAQPKIEALAGKIASHEEFDDPGTKGWEILSTKMVLAPYYKWFMKAKAFYATGECVSCGKCAASCPLNNIKLVEGRPVWGDDCTHCMACINLCPKQAIEYGEKTVGKFRHKCPRYKAGT